MDRRNLLVGLVVLAISAFALAGTASAHGTVTGAGTEGEGSCTVKSLPSFIAQGEFENAATCRRRDRSLVRPVRLQLGR